MPESADTQIFVSINFTDKTVINLYLLFTKAVIVFDCFMDYDSINHVIQQFCGQFRRLRILFDNLVLRNIVSLQKNDFVPN